MNSYILFSHSRKNECAPDGIIFKDNEVTASMQAVLDHQMKKRFDDPNLRERVSVLAPNNAPIEALIKWGFDGMSSVQCYQLLLNFCCVLSIGCSIHLKSSDEFHVHLISAIEF